MQNVNSVATLNGAGFLESTPFRGTRLEEQTSWKGNFLESWFLDRRFIRKQASKKTDFLESRLLRKHGFEKVGIFENRLFRKQTS